jgi:hypothetical protein
VKYDINELHKFCTEDDANSKDSVNDMVI